MASYLTFILFATGIAIALFSPELLRVMVPPDYLPPPLLLPLLIASYVAREIGDFFRTLMLINKRAGLVGWIALGGALLNLIANAVLIPAYGIYGAAAATFVTWFIYMVVCWVVANHEHRLPVQPFAYLRITLLSAVLYAIADGTRSDQVVLQGLLDGVWTLAFCACAAYVFLSRQERLEAWGQLHRLGTLALARWRQAPP